MRWLVSALVAVVVGFVGYLTTHTDETGILVGSILILGAALGFTAPRGAWRLAILVGLAVPASQAIAHLAGMRVPYANEWSDILTSLVALVPAFIGTYLGVAGRRLVSNDPNLPGVRE
jgi:hypothetical protein